MLNDSVGKLQKFSKIWGKMESRKIVARAEEVFKDLNPPDRERGGGLGGGETRDRSS